MQYAYIRVSSADQNTARQEEALSKAGFQPDKICVEHASAKDTNRPGLQELPGQLRPVIRFWFIPSIAFAGICRICALSPPGFVTGRYPYFSERAADVQRRHKQSDAGTAAAHDVGIQPV
ncbi:recombinase family protein [Enterobacter hormaechei]|uniref:recombinase family protein n=1 Tax=Enterobacter hormaechei TaxID=158836 RepID=UPI0040685796